MGAGLGIDALDMAGGGRLGLCRLPGAVGDLAADLDAIRRFGPAVVVTMAQLAELEMHGAQTLPRDLARLGIGWRHFPILDFEAAAAGQAESWKALSAQLHALLDEGLTVLLHCRAGLGRSGMVALRLMIERGEEAGPALVRLRAARPGAVERDSQQAWAEQGRPHPSR